MQRARTAGVLILVGLATLSCGEGKSPAEVEEQPIPPPGPNFTVSPIELDKLASITPLGHNNKILPIGHTYWRSCDISWLMPADRECVLAHLPVRAPTDGVIFSVVHGEDGGLTIEGPPGLHASFAHVSPVAGLAVGTAVHAGDTVATMTYEHSFDFGVLNFGLDGHRFINMDRIPLAYEFAQHPIEQYPEPLRSELISRVQTQSDPLGRLSYDVAGTAAGMWFRGDTPLEDSFNATNVPNQLFLARLQERDETRIMTVGTLWPGQPNTLIVIDPAAPSWDEITPDDGIVSLKAWALDRDGTAKYDYPHGTVLIEVLPDQRIRIEWFDTHDEVTAFTAGARIYER